MQLLCAKMLGCSYSLSASVPAFVHLVGDLQENPEAFARECAVSKGWSLDAWGAARDGIEYSKFVKLYSKWSMLTAQMMVHCLRSGIYSQMRNSLLVLNNIKQVCVPPPPPGGVFDRAYACLIDIAFELALLLRQKEQCNDGYCS